MAELDVISAEGFVEEDLGNRLNVRRAAVQPPQHPLGPEYSEPHFGIFASAKLHDQGWVCLATTSKPDAVMETMQDEDDWRRIERLSILLGSSWAAMVGSVRAVSGAQESAVRMLPPAVYQAKPDQLRQLRAMITHDDPATIAVICQMTFHWGMQPGGTSGPYFAG